MNSEKKRVGIYVNNKITYIRRTDLEKENLHIVIIDVKCKISLRIISLYRSFRPQGGVSPDAFFTAQLRVLSEALTRNCLVMGDFNLDTEMELRSDYVYKLPFRLLSDFKTENNLVQLIDFKTWTRTINGVKKESTLDHIYTDDATLVNEVNFKIPTFGDHFLIIAQLNFNLVNNLVSHCKRNWSNYCPTKLLNNIFLKPIQLCDVQSQWNSLENSLITAIDAVAPLVLVKQNFKPVC